MAPADEDRRELFDLLEASLGSRGAALLMSHLPPIGWADLATKADLSALGAELRGETAELRGEMAELRGEMAELRGEIAELRGEMRSAFGAVLPKLIAANIASMVGVSGLVLAAGALL